MNVWRILVNFGKSFSNMKIDGAGSPSDPACVKVALTHANSSGIRHALYFSRSIIPYSHKPDDHSSFPENWFMHVGVYAYSSESLQSFTQMPIGRLETNERLEQLRVLENGERIAVYPVPESSPGIDTMVDYKAFVEKCRRSLM